MNSQIENEIIESVANEINNESNGQEDSDLAFLSPEEIKELNKDKPKQNKYSKKSEDLQGEDEINESDEEDLESESNSEEDQESDSESLYKVVVKDENGNDVEKELSLEELARGYMQSSDYTQKTQQISQYKNHLHKEYVEAASKEIEQAKQTSDLCAALIIKNFANCLDSEYMFNLSQTDRDLWIQENARKEQILNVINQLNNFKQGNENRLKAIQESQTKQAQMHSVEYLEREINGFNVPMYSNLRQFGYQKYGFDVETFPPEMAAMFTRVLHDANKFSQATQKKPQVIQKLSKASISIKPGASKPQNALQNIRRKALSGDQSSIEKMLGYI